MLSYSSSAHTEQAIFENVKAGLAHSVMEWGLLRPIHLSHLNGATHSAYVRVAIVVSKVLLRYCANHWRRESSACA